MFVFVFERRARNALEILVEIRAYRQRNFADMCIPHRLLPARSFTTERNVLFFFFIYLFIYSLKYRWKIFKEFLGWDIVSEIGIIREEGEEGQLTKRGINFFSLSNNAGTIWSGNLTFTQSGEKRKKRIARVRNFWRRILDFRTNIEQFSCRKKCDGYWTRIWWRANIKVLRRIKILGGEKISIEFDYKLTPPKKRGYIVRFVTIS